MNILESKLGQLCWPYEKIYGVCFFKENLNQVHKKNVDLIATTLAPASSKYLT